MKPMEKVLSWLPGGGDDESEAPMESLSRRSYAMASSRGRQIATVALRPHRYALPIFDPAAGLISFAVLNASLLVVGHSVGRGVWFSTVKGAPLPLIVVGIEIALIAGIYKLFADSKHEGKHFAAMATLAVAAIAVAVIYIKGVNTPVMGIHLHVQWLPVLYAVSIYACFPGLIVSIEDAARKAQIRANIEADYEEIMAHAREAEANARQHEANAEAFQLRTQEVFERAQEKVADLDPAVHSANEMLTNVRALIQEQVDAHKKAVDAQIERRVDARTQEIRRGLESERSSLRETITAEVRTELQAELVETVRPIYEQLATYEDYIRQNGDDPATIKAAPATIQGSVRV